MPHRNDTFISIKTFHRAKQCELQEKKKNEPLDTTVHYGSLYVLTKMGQIVMRHRGIELQEVLLLESLCRETVLGGRACCYFEGSATAALFRLLLFKGPEGNGLLCGRGNPINSSWQSQA